MKRTAALFALFLGVYVLSSSLRVDTIDTVMRLEVARSLAHRGAFDIPAVRLETEFGVIGGFAGRDGRHFAVYGMGQSLLMVPFVLLGGDWDAQLVTLINPIATALACALLFPIVCALGFSSRAAVRAALVAGFATLAWPQAKLTFEAPLEMLCLVLILYFGLRGRLRDFALAGAAAGFAMLTRPTAACMVPGLLWWLWRRPAPVRPSSRVVAFALAAAPFFLVALSYNHLRWGSVLGSGYAYTEQTYFTANPIGLVGLLVSPGRGFFWFSPILILAPWGWSALRAADRRLAEGALVIAACYLGLIGFSTVWHGDWTWGPRHLLPLVPLVMLMIASFLEPGALDTTVRRGLIAVSVFVQVVGVFVSYDVYYVRMRRPEARMTVDHFDAGAAQIPYEVRLAYESLAALAEPGPGEHVNPYVCRVEPGPPPELLMNPSPWPLPSLWWFYLPLAGVPEATRWMMLIGCGALIGAGVRGLRSARET